jgi:hypothetical protein
VTQQPKHIVLAGGLDLVTPAMTIKPGRLIDAMNYEAVANGYRRMDGYERCDGRRAPTAASYWMLAHAPTAYVFTADSVVTGGTSGATGTVIGVTQLEGFVILTALSGAFVAGENLLVGGIVRTTALATAIERGATQDNFDQAYLLAAIEKARSLIETVPGSGPVRGTWVYKGQRYAFRDNIDGTAGIMHRATPAGWAAIPAATVPAGGRYRFQNYNFYGAANLERMYGCNGVGPAFEFDGATFTSISTGMVDDRPTHLACHRNHLFLGFRGGSLQNSGIGTPTVFTAITGASEIGIGQDITGLLPDVSDTLVVFGRNRVAVLYGSSVDDFDLRAIANDAGAIEWTAQKIGTPLYFDDAGLRSLDTTDKYGDFIIGTRTNLIRPLLDAKKKAGVKPVASMRVRSKDQYRIFFDDGSGMTAYLNKATEIIPFDLSGIVPTCSCASEDENGDEVLLIGAENGFVYQLDVGTSHDGNAIDYFARLAFDNMGSPTTNKVFRKVEIQLDTESLTEIHAVAQFTSPGDSYPVQAEYALDQTASRDAGYWDSVLWNDFYWSSQTSGLAESHIDGFGRDISLTILGTSAEQSSHTLKALSYHYSMRGLAR